ncbi:MAG: ArsR family transcriptional regulator [Geminicoccaceae bacterium]|nr:ArsR family transcriptional regulator [Geminicoccaceae bacterium]
MSFAQALTEDRRLVILRFLSEAPGYSANDSMLADCLRSIGHNPSRDQVRGDIAWLAEQGLLTVDEIASIMLATVTERGGDCAAGRVIVPGVKRPSPR